MTEWAQSLNCTVGKSGRVTRLTLWRKRAKKQDEGVNWEIPTSTSTRWALLGSYILSCQS